MRAQIAKNQQKAKQTLKPVSLNGSKSTLTKSRPTARPLFHEGDVLPIQPINVVTNQALLNSPNPLVRQAGKDLQSGKPLAPGHFSHSDPYEQAAKP